jgi:hypothetical protein
LCLLALGWLLTGCAHNTLEHRRQERYGAYSALPEESRQLVDTGQIKVGMSSDAVYIAWGKPAQVVSSESSDGGSTTWYYHDTHLESRPFWTYSYYDRYGRYSYGPPLFTQHYDVRAYIRAEVVFQDGRVKEWRTFPHPVGY